MNLNTYRAERLHLFKLTRLQIWNLVFFTFLLDGYAASILSSHRPEFPYEIFTTLFLLISLILNSESMQKFILNFQSPDCRQHSKKQMIAIYIVALVALADFFNYFLRMLNVSYLALIFLFFISGVLVYNHVKSIKDHLSLLQSDKTYSKKHAELQRNIVTLLPATFARLAALTSAPLLFVGPTSALTMLQYIMAIFLFIQAAPQDKGLNCQKSIC